MLGRVDRYQLLELVGEGSFGGVYRARHVHTGQIVALKLARAGLDADAAARILAEAHAAGRLDHPNVVGVLDAGVAETGETFVVMQLLEGATLEQLLERGEPLETARVVDFGLQMLDGLAAAHARGVIHRDVKPSNVFVTVAPTGGAEVVKVIDFGISKLRATGTTTTAGTGAKIGTGGAPAVFTQPGVAMGTPGYMAPEQLGDARSVDARADVYSVGATLYELLSHRKPIELDSRVNHTTRAREGRSALESWMRRLASEAAPPLRSVAPMVPDAVAGVIDRALARDRDARWASAASMRDALFRGAMGGNTTAAVASVTQPPVLAARAVMSAPPVMMSAPPVMSAPPMAAPVVNRSRRAPPRSGSGAAWSFAMIGIVLAILSILALGMFVLFRLRS